LLATSPAAAGGTKGDADFVQPLLDRAARMALPEQQAWLRQLEARAIRAAQLALGPDEAARQQKKIRTMLHQKMVTWKVLREVIEDTDRREAEIAKPQAAAKPAAVVIAKPKAVAQPPAVPPPHHPSAAPVVQRPEPNEPAQEKPSELPPAFAPRAARSNVAPISAPAAAAIPRAPPATEAAEKERPARESVAAPPAQARIPSPASAVAPAKEPATPSAAEAPIGEVEIKLDELDARVAGCNLAFRALEADLDEKGPWTAARLEPLLDRLKILVVRRSDLNMFREAVPEEKRSLITQLEPAKSAVSQLGARIFEARGAVSGTEFQGTDSERKTELNRLEGLSRRLAETAGE